jgi:hypothetical protein
MGIYKITLPVVLCKCKIWCIWSVLSHLLEITQFLRLSGFDLSYTFMIFVKLRYQPCKWMRCNNTVCSESYCALMLRYIDLGQACIDACGHHFQQRL